MAQNTEESPTQEPPAGPPPRSRRQGTRPNPQVTGEVPALGPAVGPTPEQVVVAAVTELTRIAQDLTYPLARGGVDAVAADLGASFTRLSCASRVMGQAARLTQMITPPADPELDQS